MSPEELFQSFNEFCVSYQKAIAPRPLPQKAFDLFIEAVKAQLKSPYQFLPYHKAVRSPVDYYTLGLDFIRPLIDFDHSKIMGKEALQSIHDATVKGENVILLANHQTEVDPQIISLLLEKEHPELASEMIFVAGHRVTTDPLAVPLSLGRNLICIYSKRHIDTPPEKKAEKLTHNQKALKALEEQLNIGGKCIYIAPSGGRDRVDASGQIQVAAFDPQAVEMFYLLSQKAKRPTHLHALALATYNLLPPPDQVLKEIGEQRKTSYSPAHLWFSPKIEMEQLSQLSDKKERRQERSLAIWREVATHYGKFYEP